MASQGLRHIPPARWLVLIVPFLTSIGLGAGEPRPTTPSVAMTLDVEWCPPPARASADPAEPGSKLGVDLTVTAGRIVDAVLWPVGPHEASFLPATLAPRPGPDDSWLVGSSPRGKVRVRLDAPLHA